MTNNFLFDKIILGMVDMMDKYYQVICQGEEKSFIEDDFNQNETNNTLLIRNNNVNCIFTDGIQFHIIYESIICYIGNIICIFYCFLNFIPVII